MSESMQAVWTTDRGLIKKNNEDAYFSGVSEIDDELSLHLVADGMGGHASGEKASAIACEKMARLLDSHKLLDADEDAMKLILDQRVHAIHRAIVQAGEDNEDDAGMGTTLTALLIRGNSGIYAHVGDSRLYSFFEGSLEQITRDHTQAQVLVQIGRLAPEKAQSHHLNQVLSQALGTDTVEDENLEVDVGSVNVRSGELFLLCSDGLYDMVSEQEMVAILQQCSERAEAIEKLKALALEHGGHDNVTIMLIEIVQTPFSLGLKKLKGLFK
ncbi:serine/threonine-protein phosphatase [Mariprofundus sp. EBB-1]|uniref:PP2C family protein-serine/threonine phosphatase n=1 Tax=Mariprofundus sp. EBB-1 TaxID=2650971 RepID=UPI000EF27649|nr:protein phosphatase 2C domain-containing protein [Mariprofundus sp. EBB-1]RLL49147.1 serine/threonine-protein phosphatase [Mariprofundus sp. EBB-1]